MSALFLFLLSCILIIKIVTWFTPFRFIASTVWFLICLGKRAGSSMPRFKGKIFCIGLNKTGTTSLCAALRKLGYKGIHFQDKKGFRIKDIVSKNKREGKALLKGIDKYDFYSDWGIRMTLELVRTLDEEYPGSKFILTLRDMNSWIESKAKHVRKNQCDPFYKYDLLEINIDKWKLNWSEYIPSVLEYFKPRLSDFCVLDIISGEGWEKLCPFLGVDIPKAKFPVKGKYVSLPRALLKTYAYNILCTLRRWGARLMHKK